MASINWEFTHTRTARKSAQTWQMLDLLSNRVHELNNILERSKELTEDMLHPIEKYQSTHTNRPNSTLKTFKSRADIDDMLFEQDKCGNIDENARIPQSLAYRNLDLPFTEAGKKMELLFQKMDDNDMTRRKKRVRKKTRRRAGLSDLEQLERSRNLIFSIQNKLEKNAEKYVTRAANSLRFKVNNKEKNKKQEVDCFKISDFNRYQEDWPIPLDRYNMDPELLLRLSIETAVLSNKTYLMKRVILHETTYDLYVYIFWFVHCRFFQTQSQSEQRYLLSKIALVFPDLITLMTASASKPKTKDYLQRCYPFILSKAIYLGFRYLCPGNQNLFNGAFHRILHLSVFRLLTGVDIEIGSVDQLCKNLYPEGGRFGKEMTKIPEDDSSSEDDQQEHPSPENPNMPTERLSTANIWKHPSKKLFTQTILSRQQQINFDANQISPLLQKCLQSSYSILKLNKRIGSEENERNKRHKHHNMNFRKQQFIKHTKPSRWCRTGGVETMNLAYDEIFHRKMRYEAFPQKDLFDNDRQTIVKDYIELQTNHRYDVQKIQTKKLEEQKSIEREWTQLMSKGRTDIANYAKHIEEGLRCKRQT